MVDTDFYSLIHEDANHVPSAWFDKQRSRYKSTNDISLGYLYTEIDVMKSFHNGQLGCDEAAHPITRPICESPVPRLGTYEDEIHALCHLWRLYKDALIEWPSSRTPDLIKFGIAISKTPDIVHNGEATDDDEHPLTWECLPYFGMVWTDAHWMLPKDILKKQKDMDTAAARRQARDVYVKQQNGEAQLVMADILLWRTACWAITYALERKDGEDKDPRQKKRNRSTETETGIKEKGFLEEKDFEIGLAQDEPRKERDQWHLWDRLNMPQHQFHQSLDRWDYWMDRFRAAARECSDDYTRERASVSLERMERIKREAIAARDYNTKQNDEKLLETHLLSCRRLPLLHVKDKDMT
ncbi:hypothetical protein NW768_012058 [Fusarium equiseti]|uniref:Uncharacterized protein n=1 Tax=Fusarium equiseti TaxID=61235 RepID=A0ABQ8QW23_FUSEQ|nr:hypothetical protein NW768_012058 [Fusarium equiseti]